MLANHRDRRAEIKRLLGSGYHDDGWTFNRPDGTTIHPERFSRVFLRKQEACNKAHADEPLPRLKPHSLRHTWATLAPEEGIDIHVVSDRLDHRSTHITSQIYTHVTRPMQSDAADRVAARIPSHGAAQQLGSDRHALRIRARRGSPVATRSHRTPQPFDSRSRRTSPDRPECHRGETPLWRTRREMAGSHAQCRFERRSAS